MLRRNPFTALFAGLFRPKSLPAALAIPTCREEPDTRGWFSEAEANIFSDNRRRMEVHDIRAALEANDYDAMKAAWQLNLSRPVMEYRIRKHGLDRISPQWARGKLGFE